MRLPPHWLFVFLLPTIGWAQSTASIHPDLSGKALRKQLRQEYRPQRVLSYSVARDTLYAVIHARNDTVYCFYTGMGRYLPAATDPSKVLFDEGSSRGINCEHAWPRSMGADKGNARSDMHHLFPTRVAVNAARSNLPYGDILDFFTDRWFGPYDTWEFIPFWRKLSQFSEVNESYFEPREVVKGDIARAMFYFYTMYPERARERFLREQLSTLLRWNRQDPPDAAEIERTWKIAHYQDDRPNPYILDPTLAERAFH